MRKAVLCFRFVLVALLAVITGIPLVMVITASFLGNSEATVMLGSVLGNTDSGYAGWPFIPLYPTFRYYIELLVDTPKFYVMFWNSVKQVASILAGQLLIGMPAAWALGRYKFRGRNIVYIIYIILMIMPFQVTMVSSYLLFDRMKLIDTALAVILPNIFSTFPVFIMVKFMAGIPEALIESARIDGAGEVKIFVMLGIPIAFPGILAAVVLGFLEYWNNLEQPLTFLKSRELWPMSLYLPNISMGNISVSMVASVIALLPALLIFLSGQKYLEQGIIASGMKE